MAKHPWDAEEIISVLSLGDYTEALAFYSEGQAPAKFIAASFDYDFKYVLTVHHIALIIIVFVTAISTVIAPMIYYIISHDTEKTEVKEEEWYQSGEDENEVPIVSNNNFSLDHPNNKTSVPHPGAVGKQQHTERIDNPLAITCDTTPDVSLGSVHAF
ncbi:unnamed protein product [Phytomonas sp. Hart1]|nr:unnamed protein product [Phytomonas sp. Hart1]|eukprot:CCW66669.1 unnamed protein product [Phytomonas sp. isolate Hart1]